MHHIALYLMLCIILFLAHICSYTLEHVEPESEIQAKQVQKEYGSSKRQVQGY
jgi:hypothetical protein